MTGRGGCLSASDSYDDKAKLLAEKCSRNSNFDDSGISLADFPSRTNLKLHNIAVGISPSQDGNNES